LQPAKIFPEDVRTAAPTLKFEKGAYEDFAARRATVARRRSWRGEGFMVRGAKPGFGKVEVG
jgi:hypothetical protein